MVGTGERRSDGARRREEILAAALRCFDAQGLLGVGIEDIRREAGASPSSVYHLVGNRDAVVLALLIDIFEELFAALARSSAQARTGEELVHGLVLTHLDWVESHPVRARFLYQAMAVEHSLGEQGKADLAAAKAAALEPVVRHAAGFVARGELPRWSVVQLEVATLGTAHEALRRWLAGDQDLAPAWLRQHLPDAAWAGLTSRLG